MAGRPRRAAGQPLSFVNNYEAGERRLDVLELRDVCGVMGLPLKRFVTELEQRLAEG